MSTCAGVAGPQQKAAYRGLVSHRWSLTAAAARLEYRIRYPAGPVCVYADKGHLAPRMRRLTETKPFFVTSEFVGAMTALVALAVTTASSDSLEADLLWPLATAIVAGFVFSRGFSKAGAPVVGPARGPYAKRARTGVAAGAGRLSPPEPRSWRAAGSAPHVPPSKTIGSTQSRERGNRGE